MTKVIARLEVRKGQYKVRYCCDNCGAIREERASHFDKKKRHFCSQVCYSSFRKYHLPKEEHNRYGTGHSPEERKRRAKRRSDFNHAVRDGNIIGPLPCEVCYTTHDIEAHHDDYDKPLEVRWLCFKHHREHHKKIYENPELYREEAMKFRGEK